jgi:cell division protein FtsB
MMQPKHQLLVSGVQFVAIVVLTAAIFLIIDFSRRTTTGYYISQAEKDLKAKIDEQIALQEELKARRELVLSDAYVEQWAREEAHMVRPGDRAMILVTPQVAYVRQEVPQPVGVLPEDVTQPNWHQWWALFFDKEPSALWPH